MVRPNPISHITIEGFKSIRKLDRLELRHLNVLIGANGVGKSNFVSYFRMLGEMMGSRLQSWTKKQGSADRIVSYGLKETQKIKSFIEFGRNGYQFELEPTVDGGFVFTGEKLYFDGPFYGEKWINLSSGHSESRLKETYQRSRTGSEADYCYNGSRSTGNFVRAST